MTAWILGGLAAIGVALAAWFARERARLRAELDRQIRAEEAAARIRDQIAAADAAAAAEHWRRIAEVAARVADPEHPTRAEILEALARWEGGGGR
jgi:UDP-N-acetylmuramoylalanine-D-glutamate ligase